MTVVFKSQNLGSPRHGLSRMDYLTLPGLANSILYIILVLFVLKTSIKN